MLYLFLSSGVQILNLIPISKRVVLLFSIAISLCAGPLLVHGQIEVVEGEPVIVTEQGRTYSTQRIPTTSPSYSVKAGTTTHSGGNYNGNSGGSAELFVQIQSLQVEVRELRGLVEQQSYMIEQLSQRRMDDYLDLDRRIGELQAGGSAASSKPTASAGEVKPKSTAGPSTRAYNSKIATASPRAPAEPDSAKQSYRAAYQKVKDRQFDDAKVALVVFVDTYPQSRYVPNAYFWLGELYYLDSSLEKSQQAFTLLINGYPQHRKVADAKFKLGKVYHQIGEEAKARAMLESVLNDHPGSTAANPAREYLNNSLR